MGASPWSRTYEGKSTIMDDLMRPLFSQFVDRYTARATRVIAEDDVVVIEARGQVTTKSGKPYPRPTATSRFEDGKVLHLTEYLDTELVTEALETPTTG